MKKTVHPNHEQAVDLTVKIGQCFFGAGLAGLLTQFLSRNLDGMLLFAAIGFVGLVPIVTSLFLKG